MRKALLVIVVLFSMVQIVYAYKLETLDEARERQQDERYHAEQDAGQYQINR